VIVVLHPSDELYGADRVLLDILAGLRPREPVQVWLPTDVEYERKALSRELDAQRIAFRHLPLPVLRRAYANPRDLAAVARRCVGLARELRRLKPDSVYVNSSALAPAVSVAAALGLPCTLHIHETWGSFERGALTRLCTPADVVVAVSDAARDALPEVLRRRTLVRRHRVLAPRDTPASRAIRDGLGTGDSPVVLFAGRWTPGKGIVELLGALAPTRAHLLVLGGPPPSGRAVDVPAEAAAAGVFDRVHIVGEVPDVWPYIYASDAVAVPSVGPESYPTIALEAIAAGRPVLASDTGGLPEIVRPGHGWLLPPGDTHAWSRRLAVLNPAPDLQQ
jgi:glycosyltransferase involved in cell wall biosynthesis